VRNWAVSGMLGVRADLWWLVGCAGLVVGCGVNWGKVGFGAVRVSVEER
jgi:hypothetical protein